MTMSLSRLSLVFLAMLGVGVRVQAQVPEARFKAFQVRFAGASMGEQVGLFREWAKDQAIPVLAEASHADPKFEGVVKLGKTLSSLDLKGPIDVAALTERNSDFWRATLEMNPGIPFTPMVRIALHCMTGELDQARRIADIASPFAAKESAQSRLLGEFRELHAEFSKGFEARVDTGIALHDKGDFAGAIKVYEGVLREFPKSAWTNYELFHTRRTILLSKKETADGAHASWPAARKAILAADPLYPTLALASGKDEMYDLIRRMKIHTIFKDKSKHASDMLEYADIARDLGQDGYAAMIYWYGLARFRPADQAGRELLEDFLYSLERLGVKDIKENFKGDHAAVFAKIDSKRRREKDESPVSKKAADSIKDQ